MNVKDIITLSTGKIIHFYPKLDFSNFTMYSGLKFENRVWVKSGVKFYPKLDFFKFYPRFYPRFLEILPQGSFIVIFTISTICTNVILCISLLRDNRVQNKSLRFLLSLAAADLAVGFVIMPVTALQYFQGT